MRAPQWLAITLALIAAIILLFQAHGALRNAARSAAIQRMGGVGLRCASKGSRASKAMVPRRVPAAAPSVAAGPPAAARRHGHYHATRGRRASDCSSRHTCIR